MVGALYIGVEPASSPLATINELGPAVVVSDFGNNAGLLLGPEVADWRRRIADGMTCETFIEGRSVGKGGTARLPKGPIGALAFALMRCARRGRPLRAGCLVSTGAASGIHDILPGQSSVLVFDGVGTLRCRAVPAAPAGDAATRVPGLHRHDGHEPNDLVRSRHVRQQVSLGHLRAALCRHDDQLRRSQLAQRAQDHPGEGTELERGGLRVDPVRLHRRLRDLPDDPGPPDRPVRREGQPGGGARHVVVDVGCPGPGAHRHGLRGRSFPARRGGSRELPGIDQGAAARARGRDVVPAEGARAGHRPVQLGHQPGRDDLLRHGLAGRVLWLAVGFRHDRPDRFRLADLLEMGFRPAGSQPPRLAGGTRLHPIRPGSAGGDPSVALDHAAALQADLALPDREVPHRPGVVLLPLLAPVLPRQGTWPRSDEKRTADRADLHRGRCRLDCRRLVFRFPDRTRLARRRRPLRRDAAAGRAACHSRSWPTTPPASRCASR